MKNISETFQKHFRKSILIFAIMFFLPHAYAVVTNEDVVTGFNFDWDGTSLDVRSPDGRYEFDNGRSANPTREGHIAGGRGQRGVFFMYNAGSSTTKFTSQQLRSLVNSNSFTVSVWHYVTNSNPSTTIIEATRFFNLGLNVYGVGSITGSSPSTVFCQTGTTCNFGGRVFVPAEQFAKLSRNKWTHRTLSYNSTNGKISFYVDGELFHSRILTSPQFSTGGLIFGTGSTFLEDFIILDRAVTPEEVKQLFQASDSTCRLPITAQSCLPVFDIISIPDGTVGNFPLSEDRLIKFRDPDETAVSITINGETYIVPDDAPTDSEGIITVDVLEHFNITYGEENLGSIGAQKLNFTPEKFDTELAPFVASRTINVRTIDDIPIVGAIVDLSIYDPNTDRYVNIERKTSNDQGRVTFEVLTDNRGTFGFRSEWTNDEDYASMVEELSVTFTNPASDFDVIRHGLQYDLPSRGEGIRYNESLENTSKTTYRSTLIVHPNNDTIQRFCTRVFDVPVPVGSNLTNYTIGGVSSHDRTVCMDASSGTLVVGITIPPNTTSYEFRVQNFYQVTGQNYQKILSTQVVYEDTRLRNIFEENQVLNVLVQVIFLVATFGVIGYLINSSMPIPMMIVSYLGVLVVMFGVQEILFVEIYSWKLITLCFIHTIVCFRVRLEE